MWARVGACPGHQGRCASAWALDVEVGGRSEETRSRVTINRHKHYHIIGGEPCGERK